MESGNDSVHDLVNGEYKLYDFIVYGNTEEVRRWCENPVYVSKRKSSFGKFSENDLETEKTHGIIRTALIAHLCISNGMKMEQALSLSDFYIRKFLQSASMEEISAYTNRMMMNYAEQQQLIRNNSAASVTVSRAVGYIYENIEKKLTVTEVARYTNVSEGYLSRSFMKELGVSVGDYVRQLKVDRAKAYLSYGELSMSDIAAQLSFSSQSHFTETFRKYTGMTPKKYREKYYGVMWKPAGEEKNSFAEGN